MNRFIGTVVLLILACLTAPPLAAMAQGAVAPLISLLILLAIVRLGIRPRRH